MSRESVSVRLRRREIAKLRVLDGIVAELEAKGEAMQADANSTLPEGVGYNMAVHKGSSRRGPWAVVRIWTSSRHAKHSNAKYQTLVRTVNGV